MQCHERIDAPASIYERAEKIDQWEGKSGMRWDRLCLRCVGDTHKEAM
jgi:hypothetical protein